MLSCNLVTTLLRRYSINVWQQKARRQKQRHTVYVSSSLLLPRLVSWNRPKEEARSHPHPGSQETPLAEDYGSPLPRAYRLSWEDAVCFRFSILEITFVEVYFQPCLVSQARDLLLFLHFSSGDKTSHSFSEEGGPSRLRFCLLNTYLSCTISGPILNLIFRDSRYQLFQSL